MSISNRRRISIHGLRGRRAAVESRKVGQQQPGRAAAHRAAGDPGAGTAAAKGGHW